MKLTRLIDDVFKKSSPWMRNKGREIYNRNLVSGIRGKKISDIYHIYGEVKEEESSTKYDTHIQIHLPTNSINSVKCSCENFRESSKIKNIFLCEHLVATAEMFYEKASKKVSKVNNENKILNNGDKILKSLQNNTQAKEKLRLEVALKYVFTSSSKYYEAQFKIGTNNTFVISDLNLFIKAVSQKKSITITNDFIYNPEIHAFLKKDEEIIKFIEELVLLNDSIISLGGNINSYLVKGRSIKLFPESLKRFLVILDDKKIDFKYEHIQCITQVNHSKLPISFTLKRREDKLLLTTQKNVPIDLTNKNEAYLYDRNIYLPYSKYSSIYGLLFDEIQAKGVLYFTNNKDTLITLLSLIGNLTDDINMDEGIKSLVSSHSKIYFTFRKEKGNIYCKVEVQFANNKYDILNNNHSLFYHDNIKDEKISMALEKFKFMKRDGVFKFIGNIDDEFDLFRNGLNYFKSLGIVSIDNSLKNIIPLNSSDIDSSIILNQDNLFTYSFSIGDLDFNEFDALYEAFKNGNDYYRTSDNRFIDLQEEGVKSFLNLLEFLNGGTKVTSNYIDIENNKAFYLDEFIKDNNLLFIKGSETLKNLTNKLSDLNNINYSVPNDLQATLRDYQVLGYKWLKSLAHLGLGGILADEMGLGKTIQVITFLLSEEGKSSLIVAPTSLIYNWVDEFKKFAPKLNVGIIHGDKKSRNKVFENLDDYDVLITSYGTLRRDFDNYNNLSFNYLIIDEGQNIKNPAAQNTEKIKEIKANIKFALSGTPIENNLTEIWSIFDFIMPGYLYDQSKFQKEYSRGNNEKIIELKKLIHPFILRREKKDVMKELPDKIEKKFLVEMSSEQKRVYQSYMKEVRQSIRSNKNDSITIFSYLTKLRQLCLDPSLIIDNYTGGSSKIKVALELINRGIEEKKKILLFSQFTSVLKNISNVLNENNVSFLYLDGSVKAKERVELVDKFNNDENISVFLISLKAGGTGLNLTSANAVIHFDPWWNPAIEDQATDRAHRIGQKNMVEVIKLVSLGTIEEKIITLQEDKKDLINNIMNGDLESGSLINSLSQDEVLSLFEER